MYSQCISPERCFLELMPGPTHTSPTRVSAHFSWTGLCYRQSQGISVSYSLCPSLSSKPLRTYSTTHSWVISGLLGCFHQASFAWEGLRSSLCLIAFSFLHFFFGGGPHPMVLRVNSLLCSGITLGGGWGTIK